MRQTEPEQLRLFEIGVDMQALKQEVRALQARGRLARNTAVSYECDWRDFTRWAAAAGRASLPASPETVCCYLADLAKTRKVSTVVRRKSAIAHYHEAAGLPSPITDEVAGVLDGLARVKGTATDVKAALTPQQLRDIVKRLPHTKEGVRNRCILTLGFALGVRRSDLVALNVEDLSLVPQGAIVHIGARVREKNDQRGRGRLIAVSHGHYRNSCPIRALKAWLAVRGEEDGPLFLRLRRASRERLLPGAVRRIVKEAAASIGLDPRRFGAHSLRASMITAAHAGGAPDSAIMLRSGHSNLSVMVRRYIRHQDLFAVDPLAKAL